MQDTGGNALIILQWSVLSGPTPQFHRKAFHHIPTPGQQWVESSWWGSCLGPTESKATSPYNHLAGELWIVVFNIFVPNQKAYIISIHIDVLENSLINPYIWRCSFGPSIYCVILKIINILANSMSTENGLWLCLPTDTIVTVVLKDIYTKKVSC